MRGQKDRGMVMEWTAEELLAWYEERAAIMEYEGGLRRITAEAFARQAADKMDTQREQGHE
jgi:hypothetical protein